MMDPVAVASRRGARAALVTLVGIVTSGPLALVALRVFAPQPDWENAATFVQHFQRVQSLPYLAGLLLVSGYVGLIAHLHTLARLEDRTVAATSLVFCAAYAALIVFNYMVQTTFVPALAAHFDPSRALAIEMWSMANPYSLAWSIELWGYGCLGVATWCVAPVLGKYGQRGRSAAMTFRANGIVSVATALWQMLQPGWATSVPGLVAFTVWNVLAVAMSWLAFDALRANFRERTSMTPAPPTLLEIPL